jgi:putative phage-type endonuclease
MSEQRTDDWFNARLGCLTASRLCDALDITAKGLEGAKRKQYRLELVAERLTGLKTEFFENSAMRWGTEKEPDARREYEFKTGNIVEEVGFIKHSSIEWAGASPDGFVDDGILEIKCPTTTMHLQYLLDGVVPEKYKPQMAWQMICTGRTWGDFVSYDPRLPQELNLLIKRYEPTTNELNIIESKGNEFLDSVQMLINKLERLG